MNNECSLNSFYCGDIFYKRCFPFFSFFFFFKQKTAYEISLGLVGSEMCIRDSCLHNGSYSMNIHRLFNLVYRLFSRTFLFFSTIFFDLKLPILVFDDRALFFKREVSFILNFDLSARLTKDRG